jgi:hypothetical protein
MRPTPLRGRLLWLTAVSLLAVPGLPGPAGADPPPSGQKGKVSGPPLSVTFYCADAVRRVADGKSVFQTEVKSPLAYGYRAGKLVLATQTTIVVLDNGRGRVLSSEKLASPPLKAMQPPVPGVAVNPKGTACALVTTTPNGRDGPQFNLTLVDLASRKTTACPIPVAMVDSHVRAIALGDDLGLANGSGVYRLAQDRKKLEPVCELAPTRGLKFLFVEGTGVIAINHGAAKVIRLTNAGLKELARPVEHVLGEDRLPTSGVALTTVRDRPVVVVGYPRDGKTEMRTFDLATGREGRSAHLPYAVSKVTGGPEGRVFLVNSTEMAIMVWDVTTGKAERVTSFRVQPQEISEVEVLTGRAD